MRRALLASGATLIVLSVAWWLAAPRLWGERLPRGWEWHATFIGITATADPGTGEIPAENETTIYRRSSRIASEADRPRAVRVEDSYVISDPMSGKATFEYAPTFEVDPMTGRHVRAEYLGDIFVFPRGTEKITYRLRFNYLKGVPMTFRREETVEDTLTYEFEYRGRGEYTESYAGTPKYPGTKVRPGQEIRCRDDQLLIRMWVEPVTGETIKSREQCLSGDYVYDIATGARLTAVIRWAGETQGEDVVHRVALVLAERGRLLWRFRYGPAGVLGLGAVALALGWTRGRRRAS